MSTFSDYKSFDAVGLAKLIQDGEITPEEAVASAMKAIDDLNPALNAVTTVFAERALAAARAELPAGPLRGVPFLVKDLTVSIAGVPTNCGSRFFQGWTRDFDSHPQSLEPRSHTGRVQRRLGSRRGGGHRAGGSCQRRRWIHQGTGLLLWPCRTEADPGPQ
jgi:hypothetical protein